LGVAIFLVLQDAPDYIGEDAAEAEGDEWAGAGDSLSLSHDDFLSIGPHGYGLFCAFNADNPRSRNQMHAFVVPMVNAWYNGARRMPPTPASLLSNRGHECDSS
jgi:hypothetical protein